MDIFSFLRMMAALAMVLGMLAGGLWIVKNYEIRLPKNGMLHKYLSSFAPQSGPREMELVARLPLDQRRFVALIRRNGRDHMVLIAPEGLLLLETSPKEAGDNA